MKLRTLCTLLLLIVVATTTHAIHTECSGNGRIYPDSENCECFQCFEGDNCEIAIAIDKCTLISEAGQPALLQQYWESIEEAPKVIISADYRTQYELGTYVIHPNQEGVDPTSKEIKSKLLKLHQMVGNVNPENHSLVFGAGVTQLIGALTYALSFGREDRAPVFAQIPYYEGYPEFATSLLAKSFAYWNESLNQADEDVIEFVTYPNNPNFELRQPFYKYSNSIVHDMVYYWPSFMQDIEEINQDIMLFSFSKMSGHASSRFGWGWIRDSEIAERIGQFISVVQINLSMESLYRMNNILDYIITSDGEVFAYIHSILSKRWARLHSVLDLSSEFTIESSDGAFYAWIRCETSNNCAHAFSKVGIKGLEGSLYGDSNQKMRLELMLRDSSFEILIEKMAQLVSVVE